MGATRTSTTTSVRFQRPKARSGEACSKHRGAQPRPASPASRARRADEGRGSERERAHEHALAEHGGVSALLETDLLLQGGEHRSQPSAGREAFLLGLAPAAEDEAAEREPEAERAEAKAPIATAFGASRAAASGRAPPPPRGSAARHAAACATLRRRGARGRGRRRSRPTRPSPELERRRRGRRVPATMAPARILHLSGPLHMGGRARSLELRPPSLAGLVAERAHPDLVPSTASSHVHHHGRRDRREHAPVPHRARPAGARHAGKPHLPHSFPVPLPQSPWAEFERLWEQAEPVHSFAGPARGRGSTPRSTPSPPVGASPALQGGLSGRRRGSARRRRARCRVAVLHHHLLETPWRTRKKPVASTAQRGAVRGSRAHG